MTQAPRPKTNRIPILFGVHIAREIATQKDRGAARSQHDAADARRLFLDGFQDGQRTLYSRINQLCGLFASGIGRQEWHPRAQQNEHIHVIVEWRCGVNNSIQVTLILEDLVKRFGFSDVLYDDESQIFVVEDSSGLVRLLLGTNSGHNCVAALEELLDDVDSDEAIP